MLNFVICDDNLSILDKMEKMLETIFSKYNYSACVAFKTDDFDELLDYVSSNRTDVLFLDINLKFGKSGLQIADTVRKQNKDAYIIFMTAHLEYAMMAYKFKTFDYIAKPITTDRLEETVTRLFEDINGLPKKFIKIDNKNTIIDENAINYIKRDGMKLLFHTSDRDYEIYSSFNKLQDLLPDNFVRCHKSFVVNINNVTNLDPIENKLYFQKTDSCDIGPKYKKDLMEVLKNDGIFK